MGSVLNARELTRWAGTRHPDDVICAEVIEGVVYLATEPGMEVAVESPTAEGTPRTLVDADREWRRKRDGKPDDEEKA